MTRDPEELRVWLREFCTGAAESKKRDVRTYKTFYWMGAFWVFFCGIQVPVNALLVVSRPLSIQTGLFAFYLLLHLTLTRRAWLGCLHAVMRTEECSSWLNVWGRLVRSLDAGVDPEHVLSEASKQNSLEGRALDLHCKRQKLI